MVVKKITQKPTSEQQRAIDKATRLKTSFKLIAFAGTGKTTTLIHCSSALQQLGKLGLYLSFNKKMADEANQKFAEYGLRFSHMFYIPFSSLQKYTWLAEK